MCRCGNEHERWKSETNRQSRFTILFFQDLSEHQYIYLHVPFKTSHCITFLRLLVEGVVHPEMKMIKRNVFQNLYDLLSQKEMFSRMFTLLFSIL